MYIYAFIWYVLPLFLFYMFVCFLFTSNFKLFTLDVSPIILLLNSQLFLFILYECKFLVNTNIVLFVCFSFRIRCIVEINKDNKWKKKQTSVQVSLFRYFPPSVLQKSYCRQHF